MQKFLGSWFNSCDKIYIIDLHEDKGEMIPDLENKYKAYTRFSLDYIL